MHKQNEFLIYDDASKITENQIKLFEKNIRERKGALAVAISTGSINIVKFMCTQYPDFLTPNDSGSGYLTILVRTLGFGCEKIIDITTLEKEDKEKRIKNKWQIYDYLSEKGAIAKKFDGEGLLPIHRLIMCAENFSVYDEEAAALEFAQLLVPTAKGKSCLYLAAEYGCRSLVEAYIRRFNLDGLTFKNGVTAFMVAIRNGHTPVVRFLLEAEIEEIARQQRIYTIQSVMTHQSQEGPALFYLREAAEKLSDEKLTELFELLLQHKDANICQKHSLKKDYTLLHYVVEGSLSQGGYYKHLMNLILGKIFDHDVIASAGAIVLSKFNMKKWPLYGSKCSDILSFFANKNIYFDLLSTDDVFLENNQVGFSYRNAESWKNLLAVSHQHNCSKIVVAVQKAMEAASVMQIDSNTLGVDVTPEQESTYRDILDSSIAELLKYGSAIGLNLDGEPKERIKQIIEANFASQPLLAIGCSLYDTTEESAAVLILSANDLTENLPNLTAENRIVYFKAIAFRLLNQEAYGNDDNLTGELTTCANLLLTAIDRSAERGEIAEPELHSLAALLTKSFMGSELDISKAKWMFKEDIQTSLSERCINVITQHIGQFEPAIPSKYHNIFSNQSKNVLNALKQSALANFFRPIEPDGSSAEKRKLENSDLPEGKQQKTEHEEKDLTTSMGRN